VGASITAESGWTPLTLGASLGLWLDGADAATITQSGGLVSQWLDKSGAGRNATQNIGVNQPSYITGGMNNKNILNFDGSSDFFNIDLNFLANTSHSAFIVTKVTNYSNIYGAANGGAGAASLHIGMSNATAYRINHWGNDFYPSITSNFNVGVGNILNYLWIPNTRKEVLANGISEGFTTIAGTPTAMSGGGRISNVVGQGYFGGEISEIIMLTGTVSEETRQKIEGYLAHKWGLTANLPNGHPYKTITPTTSLTGNWSSSNPAVATIDNNGVITGVSAGTATFTFTTTGGCSSTTGAVTVTPSRTVAAASGTSMVYVDEPMTAITHATTGVTGIASSTGLPAGVTASYASNVITIDGTPTEGGTFNYTITPTGCGTETATGTINSIGIYFKGDVSSDFTLGSNWSTGVFPSNDFAVVRGTGIQPVLSGIFTLGSGSHVHLQENATLTLNPNSRLSVNGTLAGEGKIIIKSNDIGTASIGPSTGTITAVADVERYIPTVPVEGLAGRRAYRLLTMPLKGNSDNSVFANWQNDGSVIAGQGMEIWGPNGTGIAGNGLAVGPFHSLTKYPTSLPATGWVNITNTKTEPLFDANRNYGFLTFPTGPYGSGIISGYDNAVATTLRASGNLITGTQTYTNLPTNLHTLIPNPYASPLSPAALLASNTGFRDKIWVWDPKLAPTGGFVIYDGLTGFSNTSGSYDPGAQIQLGQAFMVRPELAGSTFTIQEGHKGTTVDNDILARQNNEVNNAEVDLLRVSLFKQENTQWYPNDAVVAAFYEGGAAEVNLTDGSKLSKPGENIAIRRNNFNLTVEHRGLLTVQDTIPLRLTGMQANQNHFLLISTQFNGNEGLIGRLQDLFTGEENTFALNGSMLVHFFSTDENTDLTERFRIVFEEQLLNTPQPESVPLLIWPNPVTDHQLYLQSFTQETVWSLQISSTQGQIVHTANIETTSQQQRVQLPTSLSAGFYVLTCTSEDGKTFLHKFIIQ
jgi:hypothetical protein